MHRAGQVISISSISSSSCRRRRRRRGKHVSDCCSHNGRPACPPPTSHQAPSTKHTSPTPSNNSFLGCCYLYHPDTTPLARQLPLRISPNSIERTNHKILAFYYFSDKNQITNYILALTTHELEFRQI